MVDICSYVGGVWIGSVRRVTGVGHRPCIGIAITGALQRWGRLRRNQPSPNGKLRQIYFRVATIDNEGRAVIRDICPANSGRCSAFGCTSRADHNQSERAPHCKG